MAQEEWLEEEDNLEIWETPGEMNARKKRILITQWLGVAWRALVNEKPDLIRRAFERTGCLVTVDHSEDHKICFEGLTSEDTTEYLGKAAVNERNADERRVDEEEAAVNRIDRNLADEQGAQAHETEDKEETEDDDEGEEKEHNDGEQDATEVVSQQEAIDFSLLISTRADEIVDPSREVEGDDDEPHDELMTPIFDVLPPGTSLMPRPQTSNGTLVKREIIMKFDGAGWAKGRIGATAVGRGC